jgi:hypothetical protein
MGASTRIANTFQFPSIAPGASAVFVHDLRVANKKVAPDKISLDTDGKFTVVSTTISVTLTNVGAVAAAPKILVEYYNSDDRAFGSNVDTNLSIKPFIIGDAGDESALTQSLLVFRPGAPGGAAGNVFTDWAALCAALVATKNSGLRTVQFDFSFNGGSFDVPVGTWDFYDVRWTSTFHKGFGGSFQNPLEFIFLGDGVIIENLSYIEGDGLVVTCTSTTTVPMTFNPLWHNLYLGGADTQLLSVGAGAKPLIRLGATIVPPLAPGDGGALFLYYTEIIGNSTWTIFGPGFSSSSNPICDLMGRGIIFRCNWERNMLINSCPYASGAFVESYNAVSNLGAGGFGPIGPNGPENGNDYDLSSTLDVSLITWNVSRLNYAIGFVGRPDMKFPVTPVDYPTGYRLPYGTVTNCDTVAGPLDILLPGAYPNVGAMVFVADSAGHCGTPGKEITITAKAGETINGLASYTINTDRGSVILVAVQDGVGAYEPFFPGRDPGTYPNPKNAVTGQWVIASKVV